MDKVQFGRALGYGARHAAKTIAKAVDAATTPSPTPSSRSSTASRSSSAAGSSSSESSADRARVVAAAERVYQAHQTVQQAKAKVIRHAADEAKVQARGLGRSMWSPFARLSGVLWLEVTGTFFAVLALFLSQGLWKQRGVVGMGVTSTPAVEYYLHVAAFVVFLYFAVTSFVRARRRGRRA